MQVTGLPFSNFGIFWETEAMKGDLQSVVLFLLFFTPF